MNGTWKRTTSAERRKARTVKYLHVSVHVTPAGAVQPGRTPIGKGSTARVARKPDRAERKMQKRLNRMGMGP